MRPLRLELKGFTAFREAQEIDFTRLDVFAISGPTGSGKSSLLDAMTYALYGRVERVGSGVSQLVSQGQPRMSVMLEFEVGRERYRVTRSTPAKGGATKILVQRQVDGSWEQAGDGADRVREAKPIIERAVGLTYDGFTRSVLLPQGRFSEFLVGDPTKRREILTELLGLTLFKRMAERAGAIGRESAVRTDTMTGMLEREYADATPESVRDARAAGEEAERRERALAAAAEHVALALEHWQEARRSIEELRACADEAGAAADGVREAAAELAALGPRLQEAEASVEELTVASAAAGQGWDAARNALTRAAASCSEEDLADARLHAHALADAVQDRSSRDAQLATVRAAASELGLAKRAADAGRAEATRVLADREAGATEAEDALEVARHADLVAAVSAGLRPGDPCPVCGLPLEEPPRVAAAGDLDRASNDLELARSAVVAARATAAKADHDAARVGRDVEETAAARERLETEIEACAVTIAREQAPLHAVLGDPLPADPAEEIDRRIQERRALVRTERDAERHAAEASRAVAKAERERDLITASIGRQRDRLVADRGPLWDRVARVVGPEAPDAPPPPDDGVDPGALQAYATLLDEALTAAVAAAAHRLGDHDDLEHRLLDETSRVVGDLVEPSPTLEALAGAVTAACRAASAQVATTHQRAEDLAAKLQSKSQIAEEVKILDQRTRLFKKLAVELDARHLIPFLQAEALQVLAAAGSERLSGLSDGRYRLLCRDDEFLVVDTWNGDEERSVRTLSGGETFLASLALALALAEQVRSLSTTDRGRLDSLFLDEGFGMLDPEALGIVVEAIERLGGDGRLVGVITHVRDLAERFPRIEVEKSPRGSRLTPVPA